ncbi:C19orf24 isoform 2 [Pan troglodytes]|uniref:C19orf24 isoform 2 n=1 Tax=Pan troglodytes TaxID=9598 RepID=A0A2J8J229_PANTR|nr:C19orf24 isoform 2 [Pan troglodytes]
MREGQEMGPTPVPSNPLLHRSFPCWPRGWSHPVPTRELLLEPAQPAHLLPPAPTAGPCSLASRMLSQPGRGSQVKTRGTPTATAQDAEAPLPDCDLCLSPAPVGTWQPRAKAGWAGDPRNLSGNTFSPGWEQ